MPTGFTDGQTLLSNGTAAYYSTVKDIPVGPNATNNDIDSSIRFYLTSMDGRISWRAYKYGTIDLSVGSGSDPGWQDHTQDSVGLGGGPAGTHANYCVPDATGAINTSSTPLSAYQPHVYRHVRKEIYHGINQPAKNLNAFVWFGKCQDDGEGSNFNGEKVPITCTVTDRTLIINASHFGLWFAGSGANNGTVVVHYAIFGHHHDVATAAGICRG